MPCARKTCAFLSCTLDKVVQGERGPPVLAQVTAKRSALEAAEAAGVAAMEQAAAAAAAQHLRAALPALAERRATALAQARDAEPSVVGTSTLHSLQEDRCRILLIIS